MRNDTQMLYSSPGYSEGIPNSFALFEDSEGIYGEENTGDVTFPSIFFKPEVEHIVLA